MFTTGTAPLSADHYLGIYGDSSTETNVTQILASSGHFTSFYCYSSSTQSTPMVFTVRHNFASSSLTCTVPANATQGSTTGASVAFSAGDTIDILEPGNPIAGGGHAAFAVGVGP